MRKNSRNTAAIRPVRVEPDFCPAADGSVLFGMGETLVICAASASDDVPRHAESRGEGWITAEYSMLPYSTAPRTRRELLKKDGRSVEIQRLIGRALRSSVDCAKLRGVSITVDCDVLNADGGTRTASITGGYIALKRAVASLLGKGVLAEDPLTSAVAAVSLGIVEGELFLDLDYSEDSRADVDMNMVMDSCFNIIEIQGTAERQAFSLSRLDDMTALAKKGIAELLEIQGRY